MKGLSIVAFIKKMRSLSLNILISIQTKSIQCFDNDIHPSLPRCHVLDVRAGPSVRLPDGRRVPLHVRRPQRHTRESHRGVGRLGRGVVDRFYDLRRPGARHRLPPDALPQGAPPRQGGGPGSRACDARIWD